MPIKKRAREGSRSVSREGIRTWEPAFGASQLVGLAAAGTLARPYIASAAATTAEVWWAQGFVPEEDVSIK